MLELDPQEVWRLRRVEDGNPVIHTLDEDRDFIVHQAPLISRNVRRVRFIGHVIPAISPNEYDQLPDLMSVELDPKARKAELIVNGQNSNAKSLFNLFKRNSLEEENAITSSWLEITVPVHETRFGL